MKGNAVILIKHFKEPRTEKPPEWAQAKEFLATLAPTEVITVSTYPTGPDHNMVVIYCSLQAAPVPENTPKNPV